MKNYVLYDDTYLGPGIFIINKENNKIVKFLKIYIMSNYGFPNYGLRAFSIYNNDNLKQEYSVINFNFTKTDDIKNNLYKIFYNLCIDLNGEKIETIDRFNQGQNYFSLKEENGMITLSIFKDVYGVKHTTDFIDINLGDEMTCENYLAIATLYNKLLNINMKDASNTEIKKLLLTNLKH